MSKTSAKVILDSVHPECPTSRIITIEYEAPRFLLAEINTHGVLAKSAASSRAIPVEKRIEMARNTPFIPKAFGKNARGMQARGQIEAAGAIECFDVWAGALQAAIDHAEAMNKLGVHKQQANRILEPYVYVKGVVTATEWDNFFKLRYSPEADPEFETLAREMKIAIDGSVPVEQRMHLPYTSDEDGSLGHEERVMVSAARVARISYKLFDGVPSTVPKDIELCQKLLSSGHMSPFDQLAIADDIVPLHGGDEGWAVWSHPEYHGRFWGWVPVRHEIEQQLGLKPRRSSFDRMRLEA